MVDEAADTPAWVPALGLGLFALAAIIAAIQLARQDSPAPSADAASAVGADAGAK